MYCGNYGIPMWVPEIPLYTPPQEEGFNDISMIHYCYRKLLKLKENMNTKTGKEIALKRHDFMEQYLQEFFTEWNGEK